MTTTCSRSRLRPGSARPMCARNAPNPPPCRSLVASACRAHERAEPRLPGRVCVCMRVCCLSVLAAAASTQSNMPLTSPPILAAGGGDKLISIWNVITGERKSTLAREATVYSIIFSPTGDLLSTGGGDKQASLWSRHGRLLAESPGLDSAVKALAFSSTGSELACAQGTSAVTLVSTRPFHPGRLLACLPNFLC